MVGVAFASQRQPKRADVRVDRRGCVEGVRVDQPEANTLRRELLVETDDLGRVPVRDGAVGAHEDQYGKGERGGHAVPGR